MTVQFTPTSHPAARATRALAAFCRVLWLGTALFGGQALAQTQRPSTEDPQPEAPEVFVELNDGSRHEGFLVSQNSQEVVLLVGKIERVFDGSDVARVVALPTVRERYADLRRNIADDDVEQLLVLARWLRSREELGLALLEVDHVLTLDPAHPEAKRFKTLVEAEMMLRAGRGEGQPRQRPTTARDNFPTLTPEEINLLKVYEIDLKRPPKMELTEGLIDRLVERYGDHDLVPQTPEGIQALSRWRPERVLELLYRLRARDLYSQVIVHGDPKAFELFKEDLHNNWLIRSCATTHCHGGAEAGRLWLRTRARGSDETVYTNFLILDRFRLADGTPLINYVQPEQSPLIQMALPKERSERPHPPLPKTAHAWREPMSGPEDPRYKDAVDWLKAMYHPHPEYPIDYDPPQTVADQLPDDVLAPGPGGPR